MLLDILFNSIVLPVLLYTIARRLNNRLTSNPHVIFPMSVGWLSCYCSTQGWLSIPFEAKELLAVIFALFSIITVLLSQASTQRKNIAQMLVASIGFFWIFETPVKYDWTVYEHIQWFGLFVCSQFISFHYQVRSVLIEQLILSCLCTSVALGICGTLSFAQLSLGACLMLILILKEKIEPFELMPFIFLWAMGPYLGKHYGELTSSMLLALILTPLGCGLIKHAPCRIALSLSLYFCSLTLLWKGTPFQNLYF